MDATDWLRRYAAESIGGFISGSVSLVVGHPFDTVKVRLQAGHTPYAGAIDCIARTAREEGVRALYKGVWAPLLANSAMNAITFSTWQEAQRLLHFEEGKDAPLEKVFVAGALAGVVQCCMATPMELVRTKLQVEHGEPKALGAYRRCLGDIYKTEGMAGLYRGNVSMMLREAPAFGVFFSVYEGTKRVLCPNLQPGEHEPMWVEAAGGATTGALTWAAVMPIDVISTRIQSLPEEQAKDPAQRSLVQVTRKIWNEGGLRAFYKGLPVAVLRGVVLNALVQGVNRIATQNSRFGRWALMEHQRAVGFGQSMHRTSQLNVAFFDLVRAQICRDPHRFSLCTRRQFVDYHDDI